MRAFWKFNQEYLENIQYIGGFGVMLYKSN